MTPPTIAKYIARFRQERPRPRSERGGIHKDDFWWTQTHSTLATSAAGAGTEAADHPSPRPSTVSSVSHVAASSSSSLAWEVALLDEVAEEGALSVADSAGSMDSRSLGPTSSPAAPAEARYHGDIHSPTELATMRSDGREEGTASGFRDIGDAVSYLPELEDGEEVEAPAAAIMTDPVVIEIEDPEWVIQRIRRRLGLDRPSSLLTSGGNGGGPLGHEHPPIRDTDSDAHPSADPLLEATTDPGDTVALRLQDLSFELELDDQDTVLINAPPSSPPLPNPSCSGPAMSTQDEQRSSRASMADSGTRETDTTSCASQSPVTPLSAPPTSVGMPSDPFRRDLDSTKAATHGVEPSKAISDGASSPVELDLVDSSTDVELSASPPSPATAAVESRPRRSLSGLPPLSPSGPRIEIAQADVSTSDETAQTLETLLNLVVHSWGEDNEGNPTSQHDSVTFPPAAEESTETAEGASMVSTDESLSPAIELERDKARGDDHERVDGDNDDEANDNDVLGLQDPIVATLRERIALYEEALRRTRADGAHNST